MKLRVGYIRHQTMALGPGRRFAIWTQGCQRRCKGCITPEFQSLDEGYLVDTDELANTISTTSFIDGITISGGEPFLQAKALAELTDLVKELRPELDIIVFTGNRLESLAGHDNLRFLKNIDLLIDGEYIPELDNNKGLRGSCNQKFHFLTERLAAFRDELEQDARKSEVHWTDENRRKMVIIGIPSSKTK